jgi:hypothetical protein
VQYFESEKAKANAIQQLIDETDKEIDDMAYQLYGLTEKERWWRKGEIKRWHEKGALSRYKVSGSKSNSSFHITVPLNTFAFR